MNAFTFPARNGVWGGWTVAAVLVAFAFSLTAHGAQRMVLAEEWTNPG